MMEANKITKQVLDLQKDAFASWFGAVSIMQDQADLTMETMLNQTHWIPDEGRQAILSWLGACKDEGERYKAYLEKSFSGLEKYLAKGMKPAAKEKKAAPAKAPKPPVEEKKIASAKEKK